MSIHCCCGIYASGLETALGHIKNLIDEHTCMEGEDERTSMTSWGKNLKGIVDGGFNSEAQRCLI